MIFFLPKALFCANFSKVFIISKYSFSLTLCGFYILILSKFQVPQRKKDSQKHE